MARNKEVCVLMLDVGRASNDYLSDAKEAIAGLLTSKMLFKASHEIAIFLFGSDGKVHLPEGVADWQDTKNELHQEFASQGDDSQYLNISEIANLAPPSIKELKMAASIETQEGKADFLDALTAGIDAKYKAIRDRPELERATCVKRIILLSSFENEVEDDEDGQFGAELLSKLETAGIVLDVYCISQAAEGPQGKVQEQNLRTLESLMQGRKPYTVHDSAELKGLFPLREYSATAYYSGPMLIGADLAISVKVTKKCSKENMPSMNKYSESSSAPDATRTVSYDRVFKKGDEEVDEDEYAPEDMGKAYKYGGQVVPMAKEQELALKYGPDKDFSILGTVAQDSAPRHMWIGDTWFIAPEKGNEPAYQALSAISEALRAQKTGLLARFVPRANGEVSLGFIMPFTGESDERACFTMNLVPYEADVRLASFTTFAKKPEVLPSKQQIQTMDSLVDAFMLSEAGNELRAPEATSNPALHCFLTAMRQKALDEKSELTSGGEYSRQVLDLDPDVANEKLACLKGIAERFAVHKTDDQTDA